VGMLKFYGEICEGVVEEHGRTARDGKERDHSKGIIKKTLKTSYKKGNMAKNLKKTKK